MAPLALGRRVLRWLGFGLLYTLLGLALLVTVALVAINVPPVSRFATAKVNETLAPLFLGRIEVVDLGQIDLGGVSGLDAAVYDPDGRRVIEAQGVDLHLFWPRTAYDALFGKSDPRVLDLGALDVERVLVTLVDDGEGSPTLARAFEPKEPAEEEPSGPGTAIVLDDIAVERIEVRGELASPGPIDADLGPLEAGLRQGPRGLELDVARLDVSARKLPTVGELSGRLKAEVFLPAAPEAEAPERELVAGSDDTRTQVQALQPSPEQRIAASFAGATIGSEFTTTVELVGENLDAKVEAPRIAPESVRRLAPSLAPRAPAALLAEVKGALTDLGFDVRLTQERARVAARGRVRRGDATAVRAQLDAKNVDLSALLPDQSTTDLDLDGDVELTLGAESGGGRYRLALLGSRFGAEALPDTRLEGTLEMPGDDLRTQGALTVSEPGAPLTLEYEVESGAGGVVADVSTSAELRRPERLASLGIHTNGKLSGTAHYESQKDRLDAALTLALDNVSHPAFRARRLNARLMATGSTAEPALTLTADAARVRAAERTLSRVALSATGTSARLEVKGRVDGEDPDRVELSAVVAPGSERLLERPELVLTDHAGLLRVRAAAVEQRGSALRVDGLELEGPGRASGSLVLDQGLESLELATERLELTQLLAMFGVGTRVRSAVLDLEARYAERGNQMDGAVRGRIGDIAFGDVKRGEAELDFTLDRGKLSGKADLALGRAGKAQVALRDVRPPRGALTDQKLARLLGELRLDGELDLGRLRALFPLGGVERAEGIVRFDAAVEPPQEPGAPPSWRAELHTQRLVLVSERQEVGDTSAPEAAQRSAPWTLRGIDVDVDASMGASGARVRGRLYDKAGDLIRVEGSMAALRQLRDAMGGLERLEGSPFEARVSVPARALEELPPLIRPGDMEGTLSLEVEAQGTLSEPRVNARGEVRDFTPAASQRRARRQVDLSLVADYAPAGGRVQLNGEGQVSRRERGRLLALDANWRGNLADFAKTAADGKSPVKADLAFALDRFPLEIVPALHVRHVSGSISGKGALQGYGDDARLSLELHGEPLHVERLRIDTFDARVQAENGKLVARTALAGERGSARAEVTTGFAWDDRVAPAPGGDLSGRVVTEDLRLRLLMPLLAGSLSEIDGKLDADVTASLVDGAPRLEGSASLSEGVLQVPTIGQRFDDMKAQVTITPGEVRVDSLTARGISGRFDANALAKLEGLTPTSAKVEVKIDDDRKLPLTLEGESMGDAWGTIEAAYRRDEASRTHVVSIDLARFYIELPNTPSSSVQSLEPAPNVRVGFRRDDGDFVTIALQPLEEKPPPRAADAFTTVVEVDINSLWVEKGQQAKVALQGGVRATLGETLDVQGKIETRRGQLDISGKTFDIERGSVTFTGGDPSNPTISAVARYDSPAGYTVYAEYTGTVQRGSLRLRADPPLSQDEILTLLMFGTPEGSFGAGGGGGQLATAVSVAGGTAAQGLNRALSDITDIDVSARVDTSTGSPRPELVVQLTPRVTARVTQALGEPAPGQSPDRTFLTVELRFATAWSLSTMIGDRGATALDLIWRRRY